MLARLFAQSAPSMFQTGHHFMIVMPTIAKSYQHHQNQAPPVMVIVVGEINATDLILMILMTTTLTMAVQAHLRRAPDVLEMLRGKVSTRMGGGMAHHSPFSNAQRLTHVTEERWPHRIIL